MERYISPSLNSTKLSDGDVSPVLAVMRAIANTRYFTQIVVTGASLPQTSEVTDLYTKPKTRARFRGDVYGVVKWVKAITAVQSRARSEDGQAEQFFQARRVANRLGDGESGPVFDVLVFGSPSIAVNAIVPVVFDEDGRAVCLMS